MKKNIYMIPSGILIFYALIILFSQFYIPANNQDFSNLQSFSKSSLSHPLGTNFNGQDILIRTLFATKASISFAFIIAFFTTFLGSSLGLISGYFKGRIFDHFIIWLYTCIDSVPFYLFLLVLSTSKNNNYLSYIFLIGYLWTSSCKIIRVKVIEVKTQSYITSSLSLGASQRSILMRNIYPNIKYISLHDFCKTFSSAIKYETTLSFLGLRGDEVSWGVMLAEAAEEIPTGFYYNLIGAGTFLTVFLFALNTINENYQNKYKE